MRIIGGVHRHRHIKLPTVRETRATKDAVREAIFSALGTSVVNRLILDPFAGSGAYGLEALSRGAAKAIMADHNDICVKTIKDNIATLNLNDAEVWHLDYLKTIDRLQQQSIKVGLLFLDPPYFDKLCESVIEMMLERNLLTDDAIIVTETLKDINIDASKYRKVRRYRYGIARVAIMWR
jgi:16S rRNA (guanine(966)-N(2))-methyltransferase RsmD